ncbi:MAG: TetR/AcrR family transcriptional regulator [Rhodobacteraceae bacterium]|nr:MAG: TetR/AcrR family transcriptional regulator [Paracoccaceae bacterium]
MSLVEKKKRARTKAEKTDRRSFILSEAREMIDESGFDGVTMAGLAKRAGLAKGTLYLYVKTKEELFAQLFVEALRAYVTAVTPALEDDAALIDAMMREAQAVPLFLPLMARLTTIIEANLSEEALIATKRAVGGEGMRLATEMAVARAMGSTEAFELVHALVVALQGAAQLAVPRPDCFDELPEDVRGIYEQSNAEVAFATTARLILKGAQ